MLLNPILKEKLLIDVSCGLYVLLLAPVVIASKLLPPYELEEDKSLSYLLFQFGKGNNINVYWNESMAEKYRF